MTSPDLISVDELVSATAFAEEACSIDNTSNLKNSRVYLMSGTEDTVVAPGVMRKAQEYYERYVNPSQILASFQVPAEHSLVGDDFGSACNYLGSPYMNNCGVDSVGDMLRQLYDQLNNASAEFNQNNLVELDQSAFLPAGVGAPENISMGPTAYAYVPSNCAATGSACRIHVAMHGCEMTIPDIGLTFIQKSKYTRYADTNQMVVLFPQAMKTVLNPKGCFDWWGFSSEAYATKLGPQMGTVYNMITHFTDSARAAPQSL